MLIKTSRLVEQLDAYCRFKRIAKKDFYAEIGISSAAISLWRTGKNDPTRKNLTRIEEYTGMSIEELMETDFSVDETPASSTFPVIAEKTVTFPVLGEVAAGYDHIAYEDWTGDTVEIPESYLKGRRRDEFFVLRISGDSMFPDFQDGDLVLVLRQSTMDGSGRVGVVVYADDKATLKRVQYVTGEDWMRLTPINPQYPPITIRGEDLEHCRVIGIPRLLIRDLTYL